MTDGDAHRAALRDDAIRLDDSNLPKSSRGLPAKARMVLSAAIDAAARIAEDHHAGRPHGASIGGKAPGPEAELVLNNWRLPGRAFTGGTIGVAESYIDGDWESPDVTSFLELFVVNVEAGEKVAGGASWLINAIQRIRHWLNDNTQARLASATSRPTTTSATRSTANGSIRA